MLHRTGFSGGGGFTSHHSDEGNKTLDEFGISVGTLTGSIVETVLETDTDSRSSHADGTSQHGEVLH